MNKLEQRLNRVDLNLLVALNVIFKELNITKAAEALFVTQPAMSKILKKLRLLFDDPLFYRTSAGMRPTAKAIEIRENLPNILTQIDSLLTTRKFNPDTCSRTFSISIPSVLCHSVLLPFIEKLRSIAPNIKITDCPSEAEPLGSLERGKYDFAIHVVKPQNSSINYTMLGKIKPHVYARKAHPLANLPAANKLADLAKYQFIDYQVGISDSKSFEYPTEKLERILKFKPSVSYRSSHLSLITEILSQDDYLFISPSFMGIDSNFTNKFVSVFELNIPPEHLYELLLLEGPHVAHGAAEQWIKQELINTIKTNSTIGSLNV
ncbi:LysR family transcriptional regulator [Thalassotalea psychrophila]|uniref:LysR family transcriptional regulator n=1 Tax=Thalassotalea psychrophila TaxID=3065647 RepID=A0ABY9TUQ7_9GAMM|nr:LysR family transcriptional regulator [Colwelliaceae bacterium SQ149]